MSQPRTSDYPIDAQFIERWSPRAMANDAIDDQTLLSFLKRRAGRHRPTTFSRGALPTASTVLTAGRTTLEFLIDFNRGWAQHASALVVIVSKTTSLNGERLVDNPTHAFDTGAAQAGGASGAPEGWLTHCMSGIHHDKIKAALQLPDDYAVHAMVAIGKPGDKARLPDFLQEKEAPSGRLPLGKTVSEGLNFTL